MKEPAEFAVLGALLAGPAHGYELKRRLAEGLGPIWRIAPSQLYALLPRLERQGLVRGRTLPQEGRPPRRVYALTQSGEEAFWEWATSPVRHARDLRLQLLAKLYFLRRYAPKRLLPLIALQRAWLSRLRERIAGLDTLPTDDPVLSELVISFRLAQLDALLDWLGEAENRIKEAKHA